MADLHLKMICDVTPSAEGCEDCLRIGSSWVHLRLCLTCGHVGCCDFFPHKHARKHFHETKHPIIQSFEPGEDWRWCYVHKAEVEREADYSPEKIGIWGQMTSWGLGSRY